MFVKRLIYRLIHDALYDWYEEVKKGRESVVNFIIHWGLWVGGFLFVHFFWAVVFCLLLASELEFYQFMMGVSVIITGYVLIWFFADRFYDGDRPTVDGVNDGWIIKI